MGLRCKGEQAKFWPFPRAAAPAGRGGKHGQCLSGLRQQPEPGGAVLSAREADNGMLTDTGQAIEIGTPMCVKIVR